MADKLSTPVVFFYRIILIDFKCEKETIIFCIILIVKEGDNNDIYIYNSSR
jgi:hypothetical protein